MLLSRYLIIYRLSIYNYCFEILTLCYYIDILAKRCIILVLKAHMTQHLRNQPIPPVCGFFITISSLVLL